MEIVTICGHEDVIRALSAFLSGRAEQLWLIGRHVGYDGDWEKFFVAMEEARADLLATDIELAPPLEQTAGGISASLALLRFSRSSAAVVLPELEKRSDGEGWKFIIPSRVMEAGLVLEEIGGNGPFTPSTRRGDWYDETTWSRNGSSAWHPGRLHHPLGLARTSPGADGVGVSAGKHFRILYVTPLGRGSAALFPTVLETFRKAGAEILVLRYDDWESHLPEGVKAVRTSGQKFPLALRHLHPDEIDDFDYLFYWDDDIDVTGFDPQRFCRIMHENRLAMAQPAIVSPHPLSHGITGVCAELPVWTDEQHRIRRRAVGRRTNFVEIMVPVFTPDAWREFYSFFDPENMSGWGYDFVPVGRRGIVDEMPVIHTRPVQSGTARADVDLVEFLHAHGLLAYEPVNEGWLFGAVNASE
jgi:hypothetical protein